MQRGSMSQEFGRISSHTRWISRRSVAIFLPPRILFSAAAGISTAKAAIARRRKSPGILRSRRIGKVPLRKKASSHAFLAQGGRKSEKPGGVAVKAGGAEGRPVCTNEVRKIGEEAAPPPRGFSLDGNGGCFPQRIKKQPSAAVRRPLEASRPTRQRVERERQLVREATAAKRSLRARGRRRRGAQIQ